MVIMKYIEISARRTVSNLCSCKACKDAREVRRTKVALLVEETSLYTWLCDVILCDVILCDVKCLHVQIGSRPCSSELYVANLTVLYSVKTGQWRIIDFGLTSSGTSNLLVTTVAARGKACYRSPELLRSSKPSYSKKVDIWSFSCIVYELVTGQKAFASNFDVFEYAYQENPTYLFNEP